MNRTKKGGDHYLHMCMRTAIPALSPKSHPLNRTRPNEYNLPASATEPGSASIWNPNPESKIGINIAPNLILGTLNLKPPIRHLGYSACGFIHACLGKNPKTRTSSVFEYLSGIGPFLPPVIGQKGGRQNGWARKKEKKRGKKVEIRVQPSLYLCTSLQFERF